MKYCSVPGCDSNLKKKSANIMCVKVPRVAKRGCPNSLKGVRRVIKPGELDDVRVCPKHLVPGGPPIDDIDWVERDSVQKIITNLPEITEEFDVPEYVRLDDFVYNEEKIESDLIHKYITNPVCDENGYYINDHDYLGLPIICEKTENVPRRANVQDHNYSTNEHPACLYTDLRHFCNICKCNNMNLFSFNTHMMIHTLKNDVTCTICTQKFLTTTCLNTHMATHTTICDICGTDIPTVQIEAHQEANKKQKKQMKASDKYKITDDDKVILCIFCMKKFTKRAHFFQHLIERKRNGGGCGITKTIRRKIFLPIMKI